MALRSSRIKADSTEPRNASGESKRVEHRRAGLGLPPVKDDSIGIAALALSGGGIRSATLSFGVIQALATSTKSAGSAASAPLLSMFDYLSTVSGGGYIGAFLCSLFVPGRLRPNSTAEQAAVDAYATCAYIPPERLRATDVLDVDAIGKCPTAWLRENGRYLTPTGGGDGLYAAATALRNWLAIHYVLGTLFIAAFGLLALVRAAFAYACPWYGDFIETAALQSAAADGVWWWWSPLWYVVLAIVVLLLAPCGIAYWLAYPKGKQTETSAPSTMGAAAWAAIAVGIWLIVPFAIKAIDGAADKWIAIYMLPAGIGAAALAAFCLHAWNARRAQSITDLRVMATRAGATGIAWLLAFTVLALTDTAGQSLYLAISSYNHGLKPAAPAAVLAVIVWAIRKLAAYTDETSSSNSILKKLPLNLISAVVGGLMLLIVGTLWSALVQFFSWRGAAPDADTLISTSHLAILTILFVFSLVMAWTAGQFDGFINLSTLQSVYGARLTRAYLGASNGKRFTADVSNAASRSVAEPLPTDQLSVREYYGTSGAENLAPFHIINATVNQTVDPGEQLVQRDRKGRPLAILPEGFTVDGTFYPYDDSPEQTLSVGQWVGISGAALTTGLGRTTSVGTSLALGLANVRLGLWWTSKQGKDDSVRLEHWFKTAFRVQTYLLYELMARFHGLGREWQYLSDGGHFENTAMYELLRPSRGVRLIVACDNGCDPDYRFPDVANLIRLARIDYQLEIEVDPVITADAVLGRVFGRLTDFKPKDVRDEKCAILLNVFRGTGGDAGRQPIARIIVLKPKVIDTAPLDICEYQATNPDFPQQSTANQFFDEAQWESYRDLGYRIGKRVFGKPDEGGCGPALWAYLGTATMHSK